MEVNVNELTRMALDWAVGMAIGKPLVIRSPIGQPSDPRVVWEQVGDHGGVVWFAPSGNWAHGGPLIDLYGLGVVKFYPPVDGPVLPGCEWAALWIDDSDRRDGPTALIAACRCIVANKLGSVVNVPDELL